MESSSSSILNAVLDSDEQLHWSGQPLGGLRLRTQDVYIIPFSMMWGGFALFWEYMAITSTAKATAHGSPPIIFPLFGLPFVFIGLYFIFGRFFVDAWNRERTYYGVTNERIIIISGLLMRQTKSLQLRTLTDVSLTERSNGWGTIYFGSNNFLNTMFPAGAWPGAGRYAPPAFDLLENAKAVYDVIRHAQKAAFAKA